MRYYRLPPEEWHRLDDLCALHGKDVPPAQISSAYVAEDDSGQIVLAAFLILMFHFENLIGLPGNGASVAELHKVLDASLLDQIPPGTALTYYTNVMDQPRALDAARRGGMIVMAGIVPHSKTIGSN